MFFELLETVLLYFGRCYLHLDLNISVPAQVTLHFQFVYIVCFEGKIVPQFWKTSVHLHNFNYVFPKFLFTFIFYKYFDFHPSQ